MSKLYHPTSEKLVDILKTKTQNSNGLFFRVVVAYYFAMMASHMRVNIAGWAGRGTIPVGVYAIALSPSGSGKGLSTTLMETEVINTFKEVFLNHTFIRAAEHNCEQLAIKRANRNGTDAQDELVKLSKDFKNLGSLLMSFDSATTPAIKQMRQKLLMANAGSCNLQVDEIGANFTASIEPLTTYLELYDKGLLKDKLVKSSAENVRFERIDGYTPANMLLFGTPSKLLDGARIEEQFKEMLEMGYARRCLFAYTDKVIKQTDKSVDDVIDQLFNTDNDDFLEELSDDLGQLADLSLLNKSLKLDTDTIKKLIQYKLDCEKKASEISELETIKRSELEHRYFKALKLAGVYAFIDGQSSISILHADYAISLIEDSGEAFTSLIAPQRPYIKLAHYLADSKVEATLADLDEDLPSFRGSKTQKDEIIALATAWGYKNNIIIKKSYANSIMFLTADTIEETDLDKMIISYSQDITEGYLNELVPFDKLDKLFTTPNFHWVNHHLKHNYRNEENAIPSFNLLVLDVDGGTSLSTAMLLLKKYKATFYTTKRSTDSKERFRIVLPLGYTVKLDAKDFKEFYNNIINDMPFEVDTQCGQRSRKWLSNKGAIYHNEGELFDPLPYIPKTTRNEEREKLFQSQQDLDNLERWVMNNIGDGNRNNMLLKYSLILLDAGFTFEHIKQKTIELNNKLMDKLDELELSTTVFHTVAARLAKEGKLAA